LYRELADPDGESPDVGIQRIGDCRQPALIAHAVYAGHRAARELGEPVERLTARRDRSLI
jgi:dimethylamine/trimethylamine dehydrogenase